MNSDFSFTAGKPLPDWGLFGIHRQFLRIYIESTLLCPNRCSFCMYRDIKPAGTMPLDEFAAILPQMHGLAREINVSCSGESLLLDDLPERVRMVREICPEVRISLTTSAAVKRDRKYFLELFKAGLNVLQISCYAHTREDYEQVHGRDAFKTVQNNLRYIQELAPRFPILTMVDFLNDGARHFGLEHAEMKMRRFSQEHWGMSAFYHKELFPNPGQAASAEFPARVPPIPCSVVWGERSGWCIIGWDLAVLPCPYRRGTEAILGNLREMPLRQIFSSDRFARLYATLWHGASDSPICETCTQPNHTSSVGEMMRLTAWQGTQLAEREVYFWGCGEIYRAYRQVFSRTKPRYILNDLTERPFEVDGIPVVHPDEVLPSGEVLPIVVFAYPQHNKKIVSVLQEKYPWYARQNIILCIPALNEWFG